MVHKKIKNDKKVVVPSTPICASCLPNLIQSRITTQVCAAVSKPPFSRICRDSDENALDVMVVRDG